MATKVHRSLKVIAFNANGIGRQCYELSEQLQDLHVHLAPFADDSCLYATVTRRVLLSKTPARSHLNGGLVWALEYQN
jgi:hypothetical protein